MSGGNLDRRAVAAKLVQTADAAPGGPLLVVCGLGSAVYDIGAAGDRPENPETMADVLTEIAAADNKDYPAMFAEVLQALERQNAGNWMKVRKELVEMIEEDVMQ